MNLSNEPAKQEPLRVEYRYATTPEEQARFEKMQKGAFGIMGGMAVVGIILLLFFLAIAAILAYVFLHNALNLF
ncbi:MAG TPA: hypothetical protein VGF38_10130 [Ktedonobacterales bacterium]